jgi:hypothetical protein
VRIPQIIGRACALAISLLVLHAMPAAPAQGQPDGGSQLAPANPSAERSDRQPAAAGLLPELSALVPQEAQITLNAARLQVVANNSALFPILQNIARATGMEIIDLPDSSPRVSGNYGPDRIRKVLADLIAAAGYNFIMVGGASEAAPTKLLVQIPGANGKAPPTPDSVASDSVSARHDGAQKGANARPGEPLGPGALRPTPADDPSDENNRVERNMQRLQHIQEQQQQNAPE